jgi:hypothetical protein
MHLNHPKLVAARRAAVAHHGNVRMPSPAAAMVRNSAYFITGAAASGVRFA